MRSIEIKKNIHWVGAIDWNLKEFHGYLTQKGSTYNAYLIIDEKVVLVDTVRKYLFSEMLSRITDVIDPEKIDIIISNHSEMDHSGSLPEMMKLCKKATLICSPNGANNLSKHFDTKNWNIKIVNSDEKINIGKRNLSFVLMQMVHWPDSMATYVLEDKLLMPNDAFGQHLASYERYVDEIGFDIVFQDAKKYYANIILPYAKSTEHALNELDKLDIEMIAPSHGLIFREKADLIMQAYRNWNSNQTINKAVIIYDSMWGSTQLIAKAIYEVFEEKNIQVELKNLKNHHISDIMTDIIDAKYICIGSPTLNNTLLPTIASFLSYIKGLRPMNRIGLAFGSYGWAAESIQEIEKTFLSLEYKLLNYIKAQYVPNDEHLKQIMNDLKKQLP